MRQALWAAMVTAGLLVCSGTASAAPPLKVCLEEDSPPYSYSFGKREGGFDFDLAHELGKRLGREVQILWYEFEVEEDELITLQGNALLSGGFCDLLAGYPMLPAWLSPPAQPLSKLPDYEGKSKLDRKRMIELRPLAFTQPYISSRLGIIANQNRVQKSLDSLSALKGVRTGAEFKTVGALVLWQHDGGALIDDLVTIRVSDGLFKSLDAGVADATLAEVHRFERYRFRHPDTELRWTGYQHTQGYNLGAAALASNSQLLEAVDAALGAMREDSTLNAIAERNRITYFPPK